MRAMCFAGRVLVIRATVSSTENLLGMRMIPVASIISLSPINVILFRVIVASFVVFCYGPKNEISLPETSSTNFMSVMAHLGGT